MPSLETIAQTTGAWTAAGVGAGGGFMLIRWLLDFIGARADKREAAQVASAERLETSTYKLIDNLESRLNSLTMRLDNVESELVQCRAQHAQCEAELSRLRAVVQGLGDAKQKAAVIVAGERVTDRLVEKIKDKGETQ